MRPLLLLVLVGTWSFADEPCKPAPRLSTVEVSLPKGMKLKDLAAWYRAVTCDEVQAPLSAADVPLTLALEGKVPAFRVLEVMRAGAASAGYDVRPSPRSLSLEKTLEPCDPAKARALLERTAAAKDCALDLDALGKVDWGEVCFDTHVKLEAGADGKEPFKVTQLKPGSLLWSLGLREGDVIGEGPGAMLRKLHATPFELLVTRGKEQKTLRCRIGGEGRGTRLHPASVLRDAMPPGLRDFAAPVPSSALGCTLDPAAVTTSGDTVEIVESKVTGVDANCFSSGARIVPSFKDGQSQGVKLFSIRPGSLYATIGLRNGDVVRSVNSLEFSDPERVLEAWTTLRGVKKFVLKLERRGEPVTLTVVLK